MWEGEGVPSGRVSPLSCLVLLLFFGENKMYRRDTVQNYSRVKGPQGWARPDKGVRDHFLVGLLVAVKNLLS